MKRHYTYLPRADYRRLATWAEKEYERGSHSRVGYRRLAELAAEDLQVPITESHIQSILTDLGMEYRDHFLSRAFPGNGPKTQGQTLELERRINELEDRIETLESLLT